MANRNTKPVGTAASSTAHHREALQLTGVLTRSIWKGKSAVWQEEVISRVMLQYLKAFRETERPDNTRAWLSRVIRNTGYSLHKADGAHPVDVLPDEPELTSGATVGSWLQQVVTSGPSNKVARTDLLDQTLGLLDPDAGQLLRWKYLDHLSSLDIAEELHITEDVVNQRLTRAKRALRTALTERPDLVRELRAPMPQPF